MCKLPVLRKGSECYMKFAIILSALIDCFKREEAGLSETLCMGEMN